MAGAVEAECVNPIAGRHVYGRVAVGIADTGIYTEGGLEGPVAIQNKVDGVRNTGRRGNSGLDGLGRGGRLADDRNGRRGDDRGQNLRGGDGYGDVVGFRHAWGGCHRDRGRRRRSEHGERFHAEAGACAGVLALRGASRGVAGDDGVGGHDEELLALAPGGDTGGRRGDRGRLVNVYGSRNDVGGSKSDQQGLGFRGEDGKANRVGVGDSYCGSGRRGDGNGGWRHRRD